MTRQRRCDSRQPTQHRLGAGFTLIELLIVVVVMGITMMFGYRSSLRALRSAKLRAARSAASNYVVMTRAAAVGRGCRSVFHVTTGAVGTMWVTSCKANVLGAVGAAVDTIGRPDAIGTRYGVTVGASADSVVFDARGITTTYASATVRLTGPAAQKDSFMISPVGKVFR